MKAIWENQVYYIVDTGGDHLQLEAEGRRHLVPYSDPTLIIDPTDGDLAEAFAAHQAEDPHCTCPDCMEAHAEALDESEGDPAGDLGHYGIGKRAAEEPRITCSCGWTGQLSRSSVNCPICFRRLREVEP